MLWAKKPTPTAGGKPTGLDLNSSRARAVTVGKDAIRTITLDDPAADLALFVNLEKRHPAVGRAGLAICRKLPHQVGTNYLPRLGQPQEWAGGRAAATPESALAATFEKLRGPLLGDAAAIGLTLPAYLTPQQAKSAAALAVKAKLPLRGTAVSALAIAAHRAASLLRPSAAPDRADGIVPIRRPASGPGVALVADADEFAAFAALVEITATGVRLAAVAAWPKASFKAWADRLIDAAADRCVRLCRRDPRDSADAEQGLFDQLPAALAAARAGTAVVLTVRAEHWYQDLPLSTADLAGFCAAPTKVVGDGVRALLAAAAVPPRLAWVSDDAAALPGFASAVYKNVPEGCPVKLLPPTAAAEAAAALVPRWAAGDLPAGHLDATIPLTEASGGRKPAVSSPSC